MKHLPLHFFWICVFLLCDSPCRAQTNFAQGMVVYCATLSEGPKYHQCALFKSFQSVAAWFDFDIGQKSPLRIEKGLVVSIIDFNVLDRNNNTASIFSMDIISEDDIRTIKSIEEALRASAQRSPKLVSTVKATCDVLDKQIAEFKAGQVRSGGRWIERSALQPVVPTTSLSSIQIAGRDYRGPRLMSAIDGVLTLAHDGGIAKVPLASMSAAEQTRTAAALKFDLAKATSNTTVAPLAPAANASLLMPTTPNATTSAVALHAIIEIDTQGAGTTSDEALKDALRDAVRRAVGTFISADQVVKNDEIIRDQVLAYSDAFVQGYDKTAEKQDAGVFQISIRARVVRSKLTERLKASGLNGKTEVQGENMFAEALTKLDKATSAKELLAKLFTGFPHIFCRPQLIGKPAITGQTETTATLRLRVRIGVDPHAYATWYQQAATVLGQVCLKKKAFSIPRVEAKYPEELRKAFKGKLYDETPPSANDDSETARFNPKLDGLIPVLLWNDLGLERPRVGMKLCVSRSMSGFSGEAYDLDTDGASAVLGILKKENNSGDEEWSRLVKIHVAFVTAAGETVRSEVLDLRRREIQRNNEWLAPYGPLSGEGDSKQKVESGGFGNDKERLILIRPAFFLDEYGITPNLENNRSDAGIATSGVTFDFVLELPMEEIRTFQRLELSWPQE